MSPHASSSRAPWFAVFGAPAAWFASLVAGYFSVHHACRSHSGMVPLAISLVALLVSVGAGVRGRLVASGAREHERTRFLAEIGMMAGAVFSLIILLQIIAVLVLPPCQERPRTPSSPDVFRPVPSHAPPV